MKDGRWKMKIKIIRCTCHCVRLCICVSMCLSIYRSIYLLIHRSIYLARLLIYDIYKYMIYIDALWCSGKADFSEDLLLVRPTGPAMHPRYFSSSKLCAIASRSLASCSANSLYDPFMMILGVLFGFTVPLRILWNDSDMFGAAFFDPRSRIQDIASVASHQNA